MQSEDLNDIVGEVKVKKDSVKILNGSHCQCEVKQ